jgi:restriction system protein
MATKRRTKKQREQEQVAKLLLGVVGIGVVLILVVAAVQEFELHPVAGALLLFTAVAATVLAVADRRRKAQERRRLADLRSREIGRYHVMNPKEFEHALAFLCTRDGCTSVTVVGGAGDLAADVLATAPDGRRILIQAKRYQRGNNVGSPDVQKVGGTYQVVHRAQLAAVVTTAGYTAQARAYAATAGIRLFDEHALAGWASRTGPAPWH